MRRRGCKTLVVQALALAVFCLARAATGQIERQSATYDLTMEDCLAATFQNNPDLQRARAEVKRAGGTRIVYRSRALSQINGQEQLGWRQGTLYDSDGPYSVLTGQFSQPLIDVRVPPSWQRGEYEVIIAQQNLNWQVTEHLHAARLTFLQALYNRGLIALYEEINKRLKVNVEGEEQRVVFGIGTQGAVAWAKVQQLNIERDLANLRSGYVEAETRLAEMCGHNLSEVAGAKRTVCLPKPIGELQYHDVKLDWARECSFALTNRADLRLFHSLVAAAAADKQTAQSGYYPRVSLIASGLYIPQNKQVQKQTSAVSGQETLSTELRAGAAVSWTVIDNGRTIGASRRAEASRQGYEIVLHQLEQNIPRQFALIAIALQNADARRAALLKSAESAEENLKLIEEQITMKSATQLDFQKAQGNLLSVRAGILDATYAHEVARAELDRAAGRYLQYSTAKVK